MVTTDADPPRLTLFGSLTSSSSDKPMPYPGPARPAFGFRTVNLKNGAQKGPGHLAVVRPNVIPDDLARTPGHHGGTGRGRWAAREWLAREADTVSRVATVRRHSGLRAVDPAVMLYLRPLADAAIGFVGDAPAGRARLVGRAPTIADGGCRGRMAFMAGGGTDVARRPNVRAWSPRPAAPPGFAPPYDLIPKKDTEFEPCA